MADNTRSKVTLHDVAWILESLQESVQITQTNQSQQAKEMAELRELMMKFASSPPPSSGTDPPGSQTSKHTEQSTQQHHGNYSHGGHGNPNFIPIGPAITSAGGSALPGGLVSRLSKFDFPKFNGSAIRACLFKCEQFFSLDNTLPEFRVRLAALHLEDEAIEWHQNYMRERENCFPSWSEYIVDISSRFCDLIDDPLAELVGIKYNGDADVYLRSFESALTRLSLSRANKLSIFLANLSPQMQLHVRQFNPTTIHQVARLVKLQEGFQKISHHKPLMPFPPRQSAPLKPYPPKNTQNNQNRSPNFQFPPHRPKNPTERPYKTLTSAEMQERRNKGLCYFCDVHYSSGHHLKHKKAQIHFMARDEEADLEEIFGEPEGGVTVAEPDVDSPLQISMNALTGIVQFNTMKVTSYYNNRPLQVLTDSGSTHNFMDLEVAKAFGCYLEPIHQLSVAVANGQKIGASYQCRNFMDLPSLIGSFGFDFMKLLNSSSS